MQRNEFHDLKDEFLSKFSKFFGNSEKGTVQLTLKRFNYSDPKFQKNYNWKNKKSDLKQIEINHMHELNKDESK